MEGRGKPETHWGAAGRVLPHKPEGEVFVLAEQGVAGVGDLGLVMVVSVADFLIVAPPSKPKQSAGLRRREAPLLPTALLLGLSSVLFCLLVSGLPCPVSLLSL